MPDDGARQHFSSQSGDYFYSLLKSRQRSLAYAAGLLAVLALWMASGMIGGDNVAAPPVSREPTADTATVAVRDSVAETVTQFINSHADVLSDRVVPLRAETTGRVSALPTSQGGEVSAGTVIARLEMGDRQARLERARAELAQRERDNFGVEQLAEDGFATQTRVREAFAQLQAARASVKEIEEEVANTSIAAPFAGTLDRLDVEIGQYVSVGDEVARIVDNDPLVIEAQVAQQNVSLLKTGSEAEVEFVTGQVRTGTVRFIAVQGDSRTRTFRVEVEVENAGGEIPSGTSAKLRMPVGNVPAHFVSPAVFSLDDDGVLGIKTVEADNTVRFHAVDVVRAESDGVWVSGLPQNARIVTRGQGFVTAGENVRPILESDLSALP